MSVYRNPFAAPTDEERWRAAFMRGDASPSLMQQQAMGLTDQTFNDATMDLSAQERRINQQRDYANSLRGTKMPGGERVGASNIYVRNPWDALEAGFNRALGGYMAGRANRADEALDEDRLRKSRAQAQIEATKYRDARNDVLFDQGTTTTQLRQDREKIDETGRHNVAVEGLTAARDAETVRSNQADETAESRRQDEVELTGKYNRTEPTGVNVVDIQNPNDMRTASWDSERNAFVDTEGNLLPNSFIQQSDYGTFLKNSGAGGSGSRASTKKGEDDERPTKVVFQNDPMIRVLETDDLAGSQGTWDVESLAGTLGIFGQEEEQAVQANLGEGTIPKIGETLAALKLTPVSDKDLSIVLGPIPDRGTQPYGIVDWTLSRYYPFMMEQFSQGIARANDEGNEGRAAELTNQQNEYMRRMESALVAQSLQADYPIWDRDGFDVQSMLDRGTITREQAKALLKRKRESR